jgi:hypothetical protein
MIKSVGFKEDKLATVFCLQMAAWVRNRYHNFYFVKSHLSPNSKNTQFGEKISTDLE